MAESGRSQGSILAGFLWMLLLSILLFWLPIAGPFIAGFVGGRKAGSAGRGLVASILPTIIVVVGVVLLSTVLLIPGVGLLAGGTLTVVAIVHSAPLVLGALIGGATAH